MYYRETAEYVFDLLEDKFKQHYDDINAIGYDKFEVWIPLKLKENLRTISNDYPTSYRAMDIRFVDVGRVKFVLKERGEL